MGTRVSRGYGSRGVISKLLGSVVLLHCSSSPDAGEPSPVVSDAPAAAVEATVAESAGQVTSAEGSAGAPAPSEGAAAEPPATSGEGAQANGEPSSEGVGTPVLDNGQGEASDPNAGTAAAPEGTEAAAPEGSVPAPVDESPSGPKDCGPGGLLCEGFESYAEGSVPSGIWSQSTTRGAGSLTVDTSRFFSGTRSVHVVGKITNDKANIATPLQTDSNTAFVRFMMYTNSYPSSTGVHSRLMRIGTADAANPMPASSFSLASYNGTAIEKVDSIYLRSTATHFNDAALRNRWVCWEFGIDKSGGVGNVEVHIWSDGRELSLSPAGSSTHAGTSASWDPIPFELFMFGLDGNQPDDVAADYWIDDIAIATERVGCPDAP